MRTYPVESNGYVPADVHTTSDIVVTITIKDSLGDIPPADMLQMLATLIDAQNGLTYFKGRLTATTKVHARFEPFKREREERY